MHAHSASTTFLPDRRRVILDEGQFVLRLARGGRDLRAAQRLRYAVFVEELGADGPLVDHDARLEADAFDPVFDHLLLIDRRRNPETLDDVVGVYRMLPGTRLAPGAPFYSDAEYDLSVLRASGRKLLELGRSCVHRDYRCGSALLHLWNGLAAYVADHGIEVLFGVASFPGTDAARLAVPLSWLHHHHLAPPALRVTAREPMRRDMAILPLDRLDKHAAMQATPALIKAYLRRGGVVGDGASVDLAFNTTDVCLVMDTERLSDRSRAMFARGPGGFS